jgi:hypothetical protein
MYFYRSNLLLLCTDFVYLSRCGIYGLTFGINVERLLKGVVNPRALYTGACDIGVFVGSALI